MSNPSDQPLLRTERVCKLYPDGEVSALVDVDISIDPADYVAIIGTSGSGKSTLLNMLGALDRPTTGEVYFHGKAVSGISDLDGLRARQIGFVFQSFYLLPALTSLENVQVPMFESSLPARERVAKAHQLLEIVGMQHRAGHLPKQLSIGERQRVAIARALANDPPLLLADEPTGNLDSVTAQGIFDLFDRLNSRGTTVILVTHDPALAGRARRIIRLKDGRVQAD